jgi:hypothetical protein
MPYRAFLLKNFKRIAGEHHAHCDGDVPAYWDLIAEYFVKGR